MENIQKESRGKLWVRGPCLLAASGLHWAQGKYPLLSPGVRSSPPMLCCHHRNEENAPWVDMKLSQKLMLGTGESRGWVKRHQVEEICKSSILISVFSSFLREKGKWRRQQSNMNQTTSFFKTINKEDVRNSYFWYILLGKYMVLHLRPINLANIHS